MAHERDRRRARPLPAVCLALIMLFAAPSHAEGLTRGSTSFRVNGGVGLVEMPTARMASPSTVAAGIGYDDPVRHAFLTWQVTPWLETTARLTDVQGVSDDLDRSLDVKIRLFDEGDFLPAVAVGFQDFLGHGPTSAEYLVFSKTAGNFDISMGLGWGNLGTRRTFGNPLKWLSNNFDNRDQSRSGVPALKNFFAGRDVGFMAGVSYHTPVDGLELKVELNSVNTDKIDFGRPVEDKFPVNVGLSYRPFQWMEVGAAFVRGDTFAFHLVVRTDVATAGTRARKKARKPLPVALRPAARTGSYQGRNFVPPTVSHIPRSDSGALTRISKALFEAGIGSPLVELRGDEAYLTVSLPPAEAPRQSLLAAYLTFANLPSVTDKIVLRNRLADDLGAEGQIFTRDLVTKLARADAAFDDLLKAGGVLEVRMSGDDITANAASLEAPDEATVAALADLAPAAAGLATVTTPTGNDGTASVADLQRERAAAQLKAYLADTGLLLTDLTVSEGAARVETNADGAMTESALKEAAAAALSILAAADAEIASTTISVERGGVVIATAEAPSGKVTAVKGAVAKGGPAPKPGKRYLPLYGYVSWSSAAPEQPVLTGVSAPLTAAEAAQMFDAAEKQGLTPVAARSRNGVTELAVSAEGFHNPAVIVGRAGRAVAAVAPPAAERVAITLTEEGAGIGRASFWRTDLEKAANGVGSPEEVWLHTEIDRGSASFDEGDGWHRKDAWPRFRWGVGPDLLQHFGPGSEGGYKAGVFVTLTASAEPWDGFTLDGALRQKVASNLEDIAPRPSAAPRVRSDIARYVDEGSTAIARLMASYTARPWKNLFLRASAGLFEPMYGGVGLEALWRPVDSDWAVGGDINWVKQRDYDQLLSFRDYRTWTGHLSLYREWRRSGLTGIIRVGRYLAEDFGATFELSQKFRNGIKITAWATITDMSRQDFGPDSFAKGLSLTIPLDFLASWPPLNPVTAPFTVLNRDGGQRLERGPGLYDLTSPGTKGDLMGGWGGLMQ